MTKSPPVAIAATDAPERRVKSNYPQPFAARMAKRSKRALGDVFGLQTFGVNLTTLEPGGESALLHRHSKQDEFIYILEGHPTLRTGEADIELAPGMCAGFRAGGVFHQLVNHSQERVVYLEMGDRLPGDAGEYLEDDLVALMQDGKWVFVHKDGKPYE